MAAAHSMALFDCGRRTFLVAGTTLTCIGLWTIVLAQELTPAERAQLEKEALFLHEEAVDRVQARDSKGALKAAQKAVEMRARLYPEKKGHPALAQSLHNL